MIDTRVSKRGRNPSLRSQILSILACSKSALTVREIAEMVNRDVTTPFRPLKDLRQMGLVETDDSDDGTVYFVNTKKYSEFKDSI